MLHYFSGVQKNVIIRHCEEPQATRQSMVDTRLASAENGLVQVLPFGIFGFDEADFLCA